MNAPADDGSVPTVVPDPVGDVDTLVGEHLVARVATSSGATSVKTYEIQLAPRATDDSPLWADPLWRVKDGPLQPKPTLRFETLNGCQQEQHMVIGNDQPTVRLSASQPITSYSWRLLQHGRRVESKNNIHHQGISDDRRCITITPTVKLLRRGKIPLGYFFPPFRRRLGSYNGRTYGANAPGVASGLPHHAFAVDFNRDIGDDDGNPVLAAAKGTVSSVDKKVKGTVKITHFGGRMMTQYTHMQHISVEVGQTVELLDPIGQIGAVGAVKPHLHHVQLRRLASGVYLPVQLAFGGVLYPASLASKRKPGQDIDDWRAPNVIGPKPVLVGPGHRGWLAGFGAVFKVVAKLAGGSEVTRRLAFVVSGHPNAFPACPDDGCVAGGAPATVQIDHVFPADADVPPGEYSLRYRVVDDTGARSPWAFDHTVDVSGPE